jgi:outer membrane protein TolC
LFRLSEGIGRKILKSMRRLIPIVLVLGACASRPDPAPGGQAGLRATLKETGRLERTATKPPPEEAGSASAENWWMAFRDPALNLLVAEAELASLDLALADTRIAEADASLRAARAAFWPAFGFAARSEDTSRAGSATEIGFEGSWTIDVFGRLRQASKAASARREAADAAREDVRRLMIEAVTTAYVNWQITLADHASTAASEARLADALSKVERLQAKGYATALDAERSRRQWHDVRARLAELDGRAAAFENTLTLLLGRQPGELPEAGYAAIGRFIEPDVTGLEGHDFIRARGDVRQAFAELEAASAERSGARRVLLPDLSVTARSYETDAGRSVLDLAGLRNEIIVQLAMPLLFRGRQLAQVDAADARLEAARLRYEQVLLTALSEVDTALAETLAARAARKEAGLARQAAETALEQSRRLFESGEISYLDVLFAEESFLEAERAERASVRNAALGYVRYQAALGAS